MGKNKTELIKEATQYINDSEMLNVEKENEIEAIKDMTKKEIQEYINTSQWIDSPVEGSVSDNSQESNDSETMDETNDDPVLETKPTTKQKSKQKQIWACDQCTFKTRDPKIKLCPRNNTQLKPWPSPSKQN